MRQYRQIILGFLTAMLSTAVILGSLSISLSETGLKLAIQITQTRTRGPRLATMTQTVYPASLLPGETSTMPLFTPSIEATYTPMYPFATLPAPPTSCPPPSGWSPIVIQAGDTLDSLALLYNAITEALFKANCLLTEALITGSILYVPGIPPTEPPIHCGPPSSWIFYTVQPGDTLFRIGLNFGVSVADLQFANCLGNSILIRAGQRIFVPNVHTQTPTTEPTHPVPTIIPTNTPTEIPTSTPTVPPSLTPTQINSNTPVPHTATPTSRPTDTSTPETPTPTPTGTPTDTPTLTETFTPTSTETPTPTIMPTSTDTILPTATPTPTDTPETPTLTSTPTS